MQQAAEEEIKLCEETWAQKVNEVEVVSQSLREDLNAVQSKVDYSYLLTCTTFIIDSSLQSSIERLKKLLHSCRPIVRLNNWLKLIQFHWKKNVNDVHFWKRCYCQLMIPWIEWWKG